MTDTPPQSQPGADAVASLVPDLRDTPLGALVEEPERDADPVVDRVLDLEASGLLTVASFNASI